LRNESRVRAGSPEGAPFAWPVRVYYQHTDAGGMVFHGKYLDFMEAARAEFMQANGFDLGRMARDDLVIFVVHTLQITYHRPALLNDLLDVTVAITRVGRARLVMQQQVRRTDQILVEADLTLACVSGGTHQPIPLPRALHDRFLEKKSTP
jgi:acyl-CoA thioester hydrolase